MVVIKSKLRKIYNIFLSIKNKIKTCVGFLADYLGEAKNIIIASIVYILISGFMLNSIVHFYLDYAFNLVGVFASGSICYFIRYELVKLVKDIRKRR